MTDPQTLVDEALKEDSEEIALRRTIDRLNRKIDSLKHDKKYLVDAVYQAAQDAVNGLVIPPIDIPKKTRRRLSEVACPVLGDWQLGKVTPTYNSEVCEERIDRMARKVVELTEVQRADHPVDECHVWAIGDLGEGELIFPGQAHQIDSSLFRQNLVNGPRIFSNFVRTMASNFSKVKVYVIGGNHGRVGGRERKEMHPETNGDFILGTVTQMLTSDLKNVEWDIATDSWYRVDRIGEKGYLLFHGDQIKGGFAGYPWYGFGKKIQGWRSGAIPETFDYAVAGHFHTLAQMALNDCIFYANGSPESTNVWAQEQMAAASKPSQRLLFAHPRTGVTADYPVWLDQD